MTFATCLHFNLSCQWYLLHFGTSNVHAGFLRVSSGFQVGLTLGVGSRVSLGFHLGSFKGSLRVSFRVSSRLSCTVSFSLGFLKDVSWCL